MLKDKNYNPTYNSFIVLIFFSFKQIQSETTQNTATTTQNIK